MIVTVTPNPALDVTYHLDGLTVGGSQRVPQPQQRAGGKGINVARVLHDQGRPTQVVAPVGGLIGELLRAELADVGLPHSLLQVEGPTRRTLALVTPTETTNLNETGSPLTGADIQRLTDLATAMLGTGSVLVCSGSMPPGATPEAIARLVEDARQRGATSLVDTSSSPHLLAAADAGADVLKPNHHELLAAVGGDDVLRAARSLANRGGSLVYASLGAAGLIRVPPDGEVLHARLRRTLTGNTTGAGDAAVAAIADSITTAAGPADTLRLATAWSGAAVLHPLAGSIVDPEPLLADILVDPVDATPALED